MLLEYSVVILGDGLRRDKALGCQVWNEYLLKHTFLHMYSTNDEH